MFETFIPSSDLPMYLQIGITLLTVFGTLWILCVIWTVLILPSISYIADRELDDYTHLLPITKLGLSPLDADEYATEVLNLFIAMGIIWVGVWVWPVFVVGGVYFTVLFFLRFINRTIKRVDKLSDNYE